MPFVVGETVGSYRILEQLGQGGMATVFKAYHASLDRYVAIKALHPAFTEDPTFLARFQREARVVAKLEHPNIVPVYDFSEHEGRPYLVMKFIEGETLKARLSRGIVPPEEIIQIAQAVGTALSYAHQQGILHRDVKPSNVILAKDGQIYLADFGLARIAAAGESTLSSDMMLGTPQYISPEQALGKRDLDAGTDIYSFGVLLYEMIVGKVPFSGDTPYAVIHDHIYTPLPLPRQYNPYIPEELERVLLKALAKERADRYPNVDAMLEAFVKAMGSLAPFVAETQMGQAVETAAPKPAEAPVPPPLVQLPPEAAPTEAQAAPAAAAATQVVAPPRKEARPKRSLGWVVAGVAALFVLCLLAAIIFKPFQRLRAWQAHREATQTSVAAKAQPTPLPTITPVPTKPREMLFQADFDDGQLPPGWGAQEGWKVTYGALCGSGPFFSGYDQGDDWEDYVVNFRLKLEKGAVHLNLRHSERGRIFVEVTHEGFGLHIQLGERFLNDLAYTPFPFPLDEWHTFQFASQGDQVILMMDGMVMLNYLDNKRTIRAGGFSFETLENSTVCVDDIMVNTLVGKPPINIFYEQHFDSGEALKDWLITDAAGQPANGWQVKNGALCGQGHHWASLPPVELTNFVETFRLQLKGAVHLNFRQNGPNRYFIWLSTANPNANLSKDSGGKPIGQIASGQAKIPPGEWVRIFLSVSGNHMVLHVNDRPVLDFSDPEALPSGIIAFESLEDSTVCIDDLVILHPSFGSKP